MGQRVDGGAGGVVGHQHLGIGLLAIAKRYEQGLDVRRGVRLVKIPVGQKEKCRFFFPNLLVKVPQMGKWLEGDRIVSLLEKTDHFDFQIA